MHKDLDHRLSLITAPVLEPITVDELKTHLHLDDESTEQAPVKLTAALAGAGAGLLTAGVYSYRYTFVTADGETEGGTISSSVTVANAATDGKISLSAIATGGNAVTSRIIYRTIADGSDYKLVATLSDNTTTVYTDNSADASLGAGAPTTNTTEDPFLTLIIKAARVWCEKYCRRSFITQTWDFKINRFPGSSRSGIEIPFPPLQSITHVKYINSSGVLTTVDSDEYNAYIDCTPGYIKPAYGYSWPTARAEDEAVTIRFISGYGTARSAVDSNVIHAIKIFCSHLYENRDMVSFNMTPAEVPFTVRALLDTERAFRFL